MAREVMTHEYTTCVVEYIVEDWECCKVWPIIVQSITYSKTDPDRWPKREAWHVRKCGLCKQYPRPID